MSNLVTSLCRQLPMPAARKAVLMCIADYCHDDGQDWHSVAAIMEWTCLARSTVIEAVNGLERDGLLLVERVTGKNHTYRVQVDHIRQLEATQVTAGAMPPASHPSGSRTGGGADATPAPIRLPDGYPSGRRTTPVRQTDGTRPPIGPEASKASKASVKHQGERPAARKSRGARDCPPDFAVTEELKAWAKEKAPGIDIASETDKFRLYERRTPVTSWPKAWQGWMLKAKEFNRPRAVAPARQASFDAVDYTAGVGNG